MTVTGTQILGGRYALREVLGVGGMATVWLATDTELGRQVAVKVPNPQYAADPAFLTRFKREAQSIAALSSSRIVTVFDCGVDGETPYIVMELLAGRTLRQVIDAAGPLPPAEAVTVAAAVCEALEAIHAAGLVHRDIKPANIVLSGHEVKVLDFGIAREPFPAGGTRTQGVLGTASYLSPEQASGGQAGPQADLYSLGCVLFEMLTGAPPFTADSEVATAYRQVHDDAVPPSSRRQGVPAQLDAIALRLLAKNPADRPAGAAAARSALLLAAGTPDRTTLLAIPPVSQAARSAPVRRLVWRPSETVLTMGLIAALAALAVVLLTSPAAAHRPPQAAQHAASHPAPGTSPAGNRTPSPPPGTRPGAQPPSATAAGALVSDLQAGRADGQISQQAAQNLFNQLQQLLFNTPSQSAQQLEQQYAQLVEIFDQYRSQGQITGQAASSLRREIQALGAALGTG